MIYSIGATGTNINIEELLKYLQQYCQQYKVSIQAMNADLIFGKHHLQSAAEHAIRAFQQGTNTANSLAMETLLYAAGERQIKIAIEKMGMKATTTNIAFIIIEGEITLPEASGHFSKDDIPILLKQNHLQQDDSILQGDENTLTLFGITEREKKTVSKAKYEQLILEKVALVDIIK